MPSLIEIEPTALALIQKHRRLLDQAYDALARAEETQVVLRAAQLANRARLYAEVFAFAMQEPIDLTLYGEPSQTHPHYLATKVCGKGTLISLEDGALAKVVGSYGARDHSTFTIGAIRIDDPACFSDDEQQYSFTASVSVN